MRKRPLVIAIDGPAGAGKSAAARLLAQTLGLPYVDTGAMYRAVALLASRLGIPLPPTSADVPRLAALAAALPIRFSGSPQSPQVWLGEEEVTEELRSEEISRLSSLVSTLPEVRQELVVRQRQLGAGGAVVEGRDIGTVVFPEAPAKFFLTARPEVRAQRRQEELAARGVRVDLASLVEEIRQRDERDSLRPVAPLRPAADAVVVDTSHMSLEEVVRCLLQHLQRRGLLP